MVGFPLLLIPLAIYNIIVFLMPGVSLAEPVVRLTLMSGTEWPVTLSDMLLALGVLLLLFEVIKGARPGSKYLTDHLLSLVVFGAAAAEFLLWPRFGTSTFFLLAMLALVDFLSGIALRARRGVQAAAPAVARRGVRKPAEAAPEPDPVPAVVAAEAVLPDHRGIGVANPCRRCHRPNCSRATACPARRTPHTKAGESSPESPRRTAAGKSPAPA